LKLEGGTRIDDLVDATPQLRGQHNKDGFEKVSRYGFRILEKAADLPYAAVMKAEA
jgi:hypothetical protein